MIAGDTDRIDGGLPTAWQRHMWLSQRVRSGRVDLNVGAAVRISGEVDRSALERAIGDVSDGVSVLRSIFPSDSGGLPRRVSVGAVDDSHRVSQWQPDSADAYAPQVRLRVRRLFHHVFDLETEVPLRSELIEVGAREHVLVVVAHRIACDESGLGWWFDRMAAAYREQRGQSDRGGLRPDDQQPLDRVRCVERRSVGTGRPRLLSTLTFPGEDVTRAAAGRSQVVPLPLTRQTSAGLAAACDRLGESVPAVVTAAACLAIARLCGPREFPLAVSLPEAGRCAPGTPTGLAWCVIDDSAILSRAIGSIGGALRDASEPTDDPGLLGGTPWPSAGLDGSARVRVLHRRIINPVFGGDISTEVLATDIGRAPYPLTVDIAADVRLLHDPSVISGQVAGALAEATACILDAVVDGFDGSVIDLPLMRSASRLAMVARSFGQRFPVEPSTVLDAMRTRRSENPAAPAVVDDTRVLTRDEVFRRAAMMADRLRKAGVTSGSVVATLLDPSADLVVAAAAILRTGGVYLPVDRRGGASTRGILDEVRPEVVITQFDSEIPMLDGWTPTVMVPGSPEFDSGNDNRIDHTSTANGESRIRPEQPAYLVPARVTDAAEPRMVMVSHAALAEYVGWLGRLVDLQADESVLQVAPPGFDVGIAEVFGCLTSGVRLVIPRRERSGDIGYLTDLIVRHRVATMHVVPSYLVNLLGQRGVERWTSLRCIPVGGEPLSARLANRFTSAFDATLHNFYGVTEATLAAGHHEVPAASSGGFVPIGRPKDNARILVLDCRFEPVPEGIVGDIYVGGSQLAIGYHRRSAATAARFIADPFEPGQRLFWTGDRGRWTSEGLDYCGRVDRLNARGLPVERREVERVVADVLDARTAVVDVAGPRGPLVAWVFGSSTPDGATSEAARSRLAARLPDHMVPSIIVAMQQIPLTSTGAVDRAALPIPQPPPRAAGRPPRTPIEDRICRLTAEVTGRRVPSPDDAVVELGSGPTVAAELACRVSAEFGVAVTAMDIVRWSTPAAVAAAIDTAVLAASMDAAATVSTGVSASTHSVEVAHQPGLPHAVTAPYEGAMAVGEPILVVVGAGPKGIAVATKAAVLREAGISAPRVIIVESRGIGANWTSAGGWTDGSQRLGTSPEKDLGFPYRSAEFRGLNRHVDQAAQRFSWSSYLIAAGRFGEWVDRGRPAPRHREWARYLQWAAEAAAVEVVADEVSALSIRDGRWEIGLTGTPDTLTADAVMVTGPGKATSDWESLGPRIVGPAAFWRSVSARTVPDAARIAVIGAGETAGAILHEMSRQEVGSISVIAPRASLFTRGEGYFENRVFTDSVRWESLSIDQRREVIERADRGVLSARVMDEIRLDGRIVHLEGRVRSARSATDGIRLGIDTAAGPIDRDFDWVIDARGTRELWMLDVLDANARDHLERAIGGPVSLDRLQLSVGRDLAIEGLLPRLFTPSLAALRQGPGFPNLSCLGALSDRICAGMTAAPGDSVGRSNGGSVAPAPGSVERREGWTLV